MFINSKFRPYRGLEENIKAIPYSDGYVYFATDTGRIYLDYQNQRIGMGGSGAALYYAKDYEVKKNIDDEYFIDLDTLEESEAANLIKIDDLIINVDGAFYRVERISPDGLQAICTRIAISGTGGPGGTGGGSQDDSLYTKLEILSLVPNTYVHGKEFKIKVKATSQKDPTVYIRVQTSNDDNVIKSKIYTGDSGKELEIDIGDLILLGKFRIDIYAGSDNTIEQHWNRKECYGYVLSLEESMDFNPLRAYEEGTFKFICMPRNLAFPGSIVIYSNGEKIAEKDYKVTQNNSNFIIELPELRHGVHPIEAVMECNVNGLNISTNSLYYEIAIYGSEKAKPLIWCPYTYKKEISQYDNLNIEFRVWTEEAQANNTTQIQTHFYKNGNEVANSPRELYYNPTSK